MRAFNNRSMFGSSVVIKERQWSLNVTSVRNKLFFNETSVSPFVSSALYQDREEQMD